MIIRTELIPDNKPFVLEEVFSHFEHFRVPNNIEENERYLVLDEDSNIYVEAIKINLYRCRLGVKLQSFQTGEIVDFDIALLLAKIYENGSYLLRASGTINMPLRSIYENAKPYITHRELVDYFRDLVRGKYIYFTFSREYGSMKRNGEIKYHTFVSANFATL